MLYLEAYQFYGHVKFELHYLCVGSPRVHLQRSFFRAEELNNENGTKKK